MQTVQAIEKRKGAHNLALVCFLLLNLADSIITFWALAMGLMELNWYRFLLDAMPVWAVLSLKFGLAGLFAFLVHRYKRVLFKPLNVGLGLIVAFNLLSILIT